MPQLLLDLNEYEISELEPVVKNYECSVRSLYDNTFDFSFRQRCAVEGDITQELLSFLKENYSNNLRSELRYL